MSLSSEQKEYIKKNKHKLSAEKIAKKVKVNPGKVKSYIGSLSDKKEPKHKNLFYLVSILLPVIFFLVFELILRAANYGGSLDLFISAPKDYSDYMMINPRIGERYFSSHKSMPGPTNDLFLKNKPENGFRIFVMGGSTAAGFPYGRNLMFSRILNLRLSEAYPDKYIEIVNTAVTAINTYSLLDFTDEILDHKPDAVLIYSGHNEFYGVMGIASAESLGKIRSIVKFNLKLQKLKTYLFIKNIISSLTGLTQSPEKGPAAKSATLMERLAAEQSIPYKSEIYETGRNQFQENLKEIIAEFQDAGVKVILSDLVSNIRDQKPFVSVNDGGGLSADVVFKKAQNLEKAGKFTEAKQAYIRAKDLDALRFRASEDFNDIIYDTASEFKIPAVPVKEYFEKASPNGLVGSEYILEHLHPNIEGYYLMSDAFFDVIVKENILQTKMTAIDGRSVKKQFLRYTNLDSVYGDLRIRILKGGWPFKKKSAVNTALLDNPPKNRIDSIAVKVWKDPDLTLEHGHVELADFYLKNKQPAAAFDEYKALTAITPFNNSPYNLGANILIKTGNYDQALPILVQSLKIQNSYFAQKWIGQIYLNKNKTQKAVPYLENAHRMKKTDQQLLFNLCGAYALSGNYQLADESLKKLKNLNPNFPGAANLRQQLNRILKKNNI